MADTPPGAGYVSGPYDHTNDNPPHQHGGTDAPECTTCQPAGEFDAGAPWNPPCRKCGRRDCLGDLCGIREDTEYYPDADHVGAPRFDTFDHLVPNLTDDSKRIHYYGTRAHEQGGELLRALQDRARRAEVSEQSDYFKWRDELRDAVTHQGQFSNRPVGVPAESGGDEGEQPEPLRFDPPVFDYYGIKYVDAEPRNSWRNFWGLFEGRKQGMPTDEQYPGDDTPQQWSRRGLSEHIRLELEVLGLLPGGDGSDRPSAGRVGEGVEGLRGESGGVWEHDCPAMLRQEDRRITLRLGKSCAECGEESPGWSVRTDFDGEHPPVHFEWIDGFKIGDRVYHPSNVTILLKHYPNYANGKD